MVSINKIQKKLSKKFGDSVKAELQGDIIRLTGSLSDWNEVVEACLMSSEKNSKVHVVNDIKFTGAEIPKMRIPSLSDSELE